MAAHGLAWEDDVEEAAWSVTTMGILIELRQIDKSVIQKSVKNKH